MRRSLCCSYTSADLCTGEGQGYTAGDRADGRGDEWHFLADIFAYENNARTNKKFVLFTHAARK